MSRPRCTCSDEVDEVWYHRNEGSEGGDESIFEHPPVAVVLHGEQEWKEREEELLGATMLEEVFSEKGTDQGVDVQTRPTRSGTVEFKKGAKVAAEAPSNTGALITENVARSWPAIKRGGSPTAPHDLEPSRKTLAAKNENGQKDRTLS